MTTTAPEYPIYITNGQSSNTLPIGEEFTISTDLFVGIGLLHVSDHPKSISALKGKKRKFEYIIQGKFLKGTPFSNVYAGQIFQQPFKQQPPQWLISALYPIISLLQPGVCLDLQATNPYILSPLISTMQSVDISFPGNEPSIEAVMSRDSDNMSLLGEMFGKMSTSARKSYFSKRENLEKFNFETDYVYTFDFYQHVLNVATCKVETLFFNYDLLPVIGNQPLAIMAAIWEDPRYARKKINRPRESENPRLQSQLSPKDTKPARNPSVSEKLFRFISRKGLSIHGFDAASTEKISVNSGNASTCTAISGVHESKDDDSVEAATDNSKFLISSPSRSSEAANAGFNSDAASNASNQGPKSSFIYCIEVWSHRKV